MAIPSTGSLETGLPYSITVNDLFTVSALKLPFPQNKKELF